MSSATRATKPQMMACTISSRLRNHVVGAGTAAVQPWGLSVVVGWNEDEFEMFGVQQREHALRYEYAQEWIEVIKLIWSDCDSFDFDGQFIRLKAVRGHPKPYGETRPVIMNAGASPVGRAFAVRNCDAFFHAGRGFRSRRPRSASPR
jgi:alkanesulfonate monooxygenase SsuD/methylene tetrahydromethanopterin reductase-like flavin-dependent oxidoreductase (luciferase family)